MSRKSTKDRISVRKSNGLRITRDSLREIRRISDSIGSFEEEDDGDAWKLSYLREQFRLQGLEKLFHKYTDRINQMYFSLFLLLQIFLAVVHSAIILYFNFQQSDSLNIVFVDITCYASIALLCALISCCRSHQALVSLKIFEFVCYTTVHGVNLFVPLFYGISNITTKLRPAYTTYIIVACYILSSYQKLVQGIALGIFTTVSHMFVVGFITYSDSHVLWRRLMSEGIYLVAINLFGIYLHFTHELVKRRTFLDRRACVEFTLRLKCEEEQKEQLLSSIIPEHAIKEVRQNILAKIEYVEKLERLPIHKPFEIPYMQRYDNVTILYADIVNYTAMTSKLRVITLVETLNELFGGFDDASEDLNVLRIKFLGDCYYCVAGLLPNSVTNHAEACIDLGLKMISIIGVVRERRNLKVDMRIGVHSGQILSGLIGLTKWQFDIWSKDVIIANKMETTGEPGKVHITKQTLNLIEKQYDIQATNKGGTNPILLPYNLETFLISPFASQERETSQQSRVTLPLTQPLSILIENDETDNGGEVFLNVMQRSLSTPAGHRDSVFGFRRESLGVSRQISRRAASVRRFTPGEIQRRTAFMNNHISQYHDCLKTTDKWMQDAIEKMPLTKYEQWFKVKDINPLLLTFKNCDMQMKYLRLPDHLFKYYLLGVLGLLVATIGIQNLAVIDWNWAGVWISYEMMLIMLIFLIPLTWLQHLCTKFKASGNTVLNAMYKISSYTSDSAVARILIYLLVCGLYMACIFVPLDRCRILPNPRNLAVREMGVREQKDVGDVCIKPWHMSHILMLNITMIYLFLRINICLKFLSAACVTVLYAVFVSSFPNKFYENSETLNYHVTPQAAHLMSLGFFTFTLHFIDKQNEYLSKLDYLWNQELKQEEEKTNVMHNVNKMLLKNILPLHVADIYLDVNRSSNELYHEEYKNVAVMFASVVDYITDGVDDQIFLGIMNQIIREFDLLLLKNGDTIEKIKVTNWTYMAACGLAPGQIEEQTEDTELVCHLRRRNREHVAITMLNFAVGMIQALDNLNREAGQNWKLRIGITHGEVTAGVVGSKKPLYDIWGDTVNMASRMESTGVSENIQVTESTASIFREHGIMCDFRDHIFVRGKENLVPTYFVRLDDEHRLVLSTT